MKYKITTYRTLTGTKDILDLPKKKTGQWVVYLNNLPAYHVDCFDFKEESNLILNNLILSEQKTIREVIRKIKRTQKVNLSIPKIPFIEIAIKSEFKELELGPLPEEWLTL
ncbi:MAG: hypothetical protein JKY69_02120 [Flavobacteriaceae bacterium]|nr:hypothetical protein [Flavobacteriaceae bacterium]MBL4905702.1 hypothetical protein [Flavobacteriaceae bacterium]